MDLPSNLPLRRTRILSGIAVAGLLLLTGCANGDFGEVRPMFASEGMHDWLGPAASGLPASSFELTDDERQLRDLAYPLIQPPFDRQRFYSVLGEYGLLGPDHPDGFDVTNYVNRLFQDEPYRSPTARYARVLEDIRNDNERMPQFFATAWRVLDMDAKRRKSMTLVSVSEKERKNAERRMRENALLVNWVQQSLRERADAYRFALERLVVMDPSPSAVDIERAIVHLKARIAQRPGFVPQQPSRGVYVRNSL
ncbi:MAG TPA: hypothetical protein VFB45_26180 [Pseudolabrys sp.]|nr:hypothetical protein [Pseudolabrys sp.]